MDPRPHADGTLRAFIAVPLEEPVRRAAAECICALRERPGGAAVRWVRPENFHVTLRFLGDVAHSAVPHLAACVREQTAGLAPFALQLDGVQLFPSFPAAGRPRAVVQGVEPEAPLVRLALAVDLGAREAGFEGEKRRFRPHLTLGRLPRKRARRRVSEGGGQRSESTATLSERKGQRHPTLQRGFFLDLSDLDGPMGPGFEVCEAQLIRSELFASGARYTLLERFPLTGGGGSEYHPIHPLDSN